MRFREWAAINGVNVDKVSYPAAFGKDGALTGGFASQPIPEGECFVEVPESATISRKSVYNSELKPLFDRHPEIFDKHQELDLSIVIYVWYERMKGEGSRWYVPF